MIKVIKYGKKRRVLCEHCESLLEFEKEDIKTVQRGMNEWEKQIICPVCDMPVSIVVRSQCIISPIFSHVKPSIYRNCMMRLILLSGILFMYWINLFSSFAAFFLLSSSNIFFSHKCSERFFASTGLYPWTIAFPWIYGKFFLEASTVTGASPIYICCIFRILCSSSLISFFKSINCSSSFFVTPIPHFWSVIPWLKLAYHTLDIWFVFPPGSKSYGSRGRRMQYWGTNIMHYMMQRLLENCIRF